MKIRGNQGLPQTKFIYINRYPESYILNPAPESPFLHLEGGGYLRHDGGGGVEDGGGGGGGGEPPAQVLVPGHRAAQVHERGDIPAL